MSGRDGCFGCRKLQAQIDYANRLLEHFMKERSEGFPIARGSGVKPPRVPGGRVPKGKQPRPLVFLKEIATDRRELKRNA